MADDPVVVEHRHAVAGQPDVALQAGGAETQPELERLQRVLRRMGSAPRWAKPIGRASSEGSRCCTATDYAKQDRRLRRVFNLSGSEIIVILLLALVVLGPEKLPDALRRAGRTYAELKKMGNSFQDEMRSVIDEPVKEMRETADLLRSSASFTDADPKKPGSGGRATPQLPASTPTTANPAVIAAPDAHRRPCRPATPAAPAATRKPPTPPPLSSAADDAEAAINRTLSGQSDPPAGDATA